MPTRDELIRSLIQLDLATLDDVVTSAYRQRAEIEGTVGEQSPRPDATAREFAQWLARRHLSSDGAIDRVVYLPSGSPADEIRLLEVNRFLNAPDPDLVKPLDFSPDADPPFKVFVADITSDQWERIQQDPDSILPAGWMLEGNQIIARG